MKNTRTRICKKLTKHANQIALFTNFYFEGKKNPNVSHGDIKINLKGQRDGV